MTIMMQLFISAVSIYVIRSDIQCNNLWSAINTMQLGVDLATFDMFGHSPGWSMMPLLQYTCNQNRTWINSINKIQYCLPDQLAEQPISIPDDVTFTTSHQTTTTKGVEMWMSQSISASLIKGMFSATQTISQAYGVITSGTRLWGTENSSVSSFKVNFIPHEINPQLIRLSDNAQNYIDQTIKQQGPIFNESTVDLYETFFKYFGTHVFTTADTGGVFHLRYETDKALLAQMSSEKISEQGSISFWNFLDASGAVSGGKKQVDARFVSMSTMITMCKGGSFCPNAQSNDYDEWQISVASTPWIMSAEFIPVYKLIYNDTRVADSFVEAILNHQQMSYLTNEIAANIDMVKNVISNAIQPIVSVPAKIDGVSSTDWISDCVSTVCNNNNNTQHCTRLNGQQCNHADKGPTGGRDMYNEKNTFHNYIPSGMSLITFVQNLQNTQTKIFKQIDLVQSNVKLLLALPLIKNQTLFNETAALWENVLLFAQSKYVWDAAAYSYTNSICVKSNGNCAHYACYSGYSYCGPYTIKQNLTYLQSLAIYNTTV
eukprot:383318_1